MSAPERGVGESYVSGEENRMSGPMTSARGKRGKRFLARPLAAFAAVAAIAASAAVLPTQALGADPLPEGFAYEQISPPFTGGQRVLLGAFGPDELSIMTNSPGGYADAENLPDFGVHYIATRTDVGWISQAVTPPARDVPYVGSNRYLLDWTPDFGRTLWYPELAENKGTGKYTPVIREADGSLTIAGPTSTGAEGLNEYPEGTSLDFGTIVLKTSRRAGLLTDETTDTRSGARRSLVVVRRAEDGTFSVEQLGYRNGATMSTSCNLGLGGRTARGAISADGEKVFFSPEGTGACATASARRVWVKIGSDNPIDLSETQCTDTCGSAAASHFVGASRDGNRVFIVTAQKLINDDQDTSARDDLYEYDFRDPTAPLKPVTSSLQAEGAGVVSVVRISEDGAYVYFVAKGRALAGANPLGAVPLPENNNLYVAHRTPGAARASIKFVGALDPADSELINLAGSVRPAFTSIDGRFLLFGSRADLVGERAPGDSHVDPYRYDAVDHELIRIWTDDPEHNGVARTDGAELAGPQESFAFQNLWRNVWRMSDDGKTIAFETSERISDSDINDQPDTYMWLEDIGELTMISDGRSVVPSRFQGVSPSGDMVLFTSTEPMVPSHRTNASALFAVRRGGGFPEIPPDVETPCVGEECQGPTSAPPVLPGIASVSHSGDGNAPTVPDLVKGSVRVSRVKAVTGAAARLRVRVPGAGRVSLAGSSVRRARKSASKAGVYTLRIALKPRARKLLRKKKRLRVSARVSYLAADGQSASRTIKVTFKQPSSRTKAKKGGR